MRKTDNLGLALVEDSDPLKSAVEAMPNANMEALDAAAEAARMRSVLDARRTAEAVNAIADLSGAAEVKLSFGKTTIKKAYVGDEEWSALGSGLGAPMYGHAGELVVLPDYVIETNRNAEGSSPVRQVGWSTVLYPDEAHGLDALPGGLYRLPEADTMLRAVYAVAFELNANDGSGAARKVERFCVPACPFEREGYEFACWNTEPDGSGVDYAAGSSISAKTQNAGALALHAVWNPSGGGLARSLAGLTVGDLGEVVANG